MKRWDAALNNRDGCQDTKQLTHHGRIGEVEDMSSFLG